MSQTDPGMLLEPGEPNEPLRDDALRKALAQAPDRAALPDWRVRQSILEHAHDAISASEDLLAASREHAPWWRLAWWRDKVGLSGATPWNAALASLMVAILVTVIWQREPVPGARPDDQPAAASAPIAMGESGKETSIAKEEPANPPPTAPAASPAPAMPATAATPATPATAPVPPRQAPKPEEPPPPVAPPPAAAQVPGRGSVAPTQRDAATGVAGMARPPADSFEAAPAMRANPPAPPLTADSSAERRKSAPAPAPAPVAPLVAQSSPVPDARPSGAGRASREAAPDTSAPGARGEAMPMPDFSSLSRWTELRVANVSGDVRVVSRAEAGELGLLMSSAAIMAVGAPPLRALPQWRVSLERRGQVLAVLEVARNDVRWTEGASPPTTGTPSPEALEALRRALGQALKSGAAARPMPAQPPAKTPEAGSPPSGRLPYAPLAPPALPPVEMPVPAAPQANEAQPADPPRAPE